MHINVILGNSIDSSICVKKLKYIGEEFIVVLDYDLKIDEIYESDIHYVSAEYASKLVREFRTVKYYKSLYVFPGMYKKIN